MITDFDATAGEKRDAAGEVGEFGALAEVEGGAGGAKLIVEVMNEGVFLFADVAVL